MGAFALCLALACSDGSAATRDAAVARGLRTYQNVCIACHNADPSQDGVLGPAIAGASQELLAAKVLRGEYPAGHVPRLNSASMPQFAYLAERIPDLAAYLGSVSKPADAR